MSQELERLLRASTQAEPPAWLDQLVTERVVDLVQGQAPYAALRSRRRAAAASALRQTWQLLRRGALLLLARPRRAPAAGPPLVHGPNQA